MSRGRFGWWVRGGGISWKWNTEAHKREKRWWGGVILVCIFFVEMVQLAFIAYDHGVDSEDVHVRVHYARLQ